MKLFDHTIDRLSDALDVRLARQTVLSGNLANVDTPGYASRDVDFDGAMDELARAREAGSSVDVARVVDDETHEDETATGALDGNGVDLDRTMAALAENGLHYGAAARTVSKKLALLRYVVTDGQG
jgi:flagellar basal-body rod protein FlgB